MQWTVEKLASKSVHDRQQLWKNARSKDTTEAKALVQMNETCGLPYSDDAPLKASDPLVQKMVEIINSPGAIDAAIKATVDRFPAMQGVDPILAQALGVDYGP